MRQTFTVKVKIGPEMASRQHQYDWLIEIFVDGRMVTNRVVSKDPKGREVSVAHMTFEEAGVKYDGLLKFAALVSLSAYNRISTDSSENDRQG
jgi:hypothetical protein